MELIAPDLAQYPDVKVRLVGEDGNAFAIIGRVSGALRRAGHTNASKEFADEAMTGDYNHVLRTVMAYVSVEDFDEDDEDFDDDQFLGWD